MPRKYDKSGTNNNLVKLNSWGKVLDRNISSAYNCSTLSLVKFFSDFPKSYRNDILKQLKRIVIYDEIDDEHSRIGIIKLMVSFLPESMPLIKEILKLKRNKLDYELHFTLFCYIDDAIYFQDSLIIDQLTEELINYLENASVYTANAAWMVGHLLVDHWPLKNSFLALLKIAEDGKYRVGREIAISGMGKILPKLSDRNQKIVVEKLNRIYKKDASKEVRLLSKITIDNINLK